MPYVPPTIASEYQPKSVVADLLPPLPGPNGGILINPTNDQWVDVSSIAPYPYTAQTYVLTVLENDPRPVFRMAQLRFFPRANPINAIVYGRLVAKWTDQSGSFSQVVSPEIPSKPGFLGNCGDWCHDKINDLVVNRAFATQLNFMMQIKTPPSVSVMLFGARLEMA